MITGNLNVDGNKQYEVHSIYVPDILNEINDNSLTIREQFAMAAMVGFINTGCVRDDNNGVVNNQYNYASIAKSAVDQADALIDALNKEV